MGSTLVHAVPRLLIRLPLMADESVVSFIQRHAQANRAASMRDMLRLLERVSGERLRDIRDVPIRRSALRAVEWLTGLADGALESRYLSTPQSTHLSFDHHMWERSARVAARQAVCPACLEEFGYGRVGWEFVQAPVCLVHGTALLEHCPSCTAQLRHSRRRLRFCDECGSDLGKASASPVSPAALQLASLIQSPSMVRMGSSESTAPIDQLDLSNLLRLCMLPGPGRPSSYGLKGPLDSFSVADRTTALERLGTTLVGGCIDCGRLRSIILQRWPGASLLPHVAALLLVQDATQTVELDQDVSCHLCHGDLRQRPQTAAELFEGRPPHLPTSEDVARYLGVDVHVLGQLGVRHGLQRACRGQGHDMDEVLALKRHLGAVCAPEVLDEVLGRPGLTSALVDLKLLTGLYTESGRLLGVEPDSFALLVSRIQSVMTPSLRRDLRKR